MLPRRSYCTHGQIHLWRLKQLTTVSIQIQYTQTLAYSVFRSNASTIPLLKGILARHTPSRSLYHPSSSSNQESHAGLEQAVHPRQYADDSSYDLQM